MHCTDSIDLFQFNVGLVADLSKGKVQKKRGKKLTSVSFMYVCVAGNGEMLVFFFLFSPNNSLIDHVRLGKKEKC